MTERSPSYQITVEPKDGYLHVRVHGPSSPATVRGYLTAMRGACLERKCVKVLIEENLQGPGLDLAEIFFIIQERSEQVPRLIRRIAYLNLNPDHSRQDLRFIETASVNRGINVRVFDRLGEAEAWIRDE